MAIITGPRELVVGAGPGPESVLLAELYAAALRYYGTGARVESVPDPLTRLDTGEFAVVPAFTGRVLQRYQPGAAAGAGPNGVPSDGGGAA